MASKPPADWVPAGDMGLGLCYQGTKVLAERALEYAAWAANKTRPEPAPGFVPNFAVVIAPYPMGGAVLALPVCFGCLTGGPGACGGLEVDQRAGGGLFLPRNGFGRP